MNNSPGRGFPGAFFLRTARRLYADRVVSAVFVAAIADFQEELRETDGDGLAHLVARCRWYRALLALLMTTPFIVRGSLRADQAALARTIARGWLFVALYTLPFSGAWSCVREFTILASAGGSVLACVMRAWHDQRSSLAGILGLRLPWDYLTTQAAVPALTATFLAPSLADTTVD